jgi:hypothetical protein
VKKHVIGLLLGAENDWPTAFEALVRRANLAFAHGGETHTFETSRVTIEPFDLRQPPKYEVVIDRLAYWYFHPREWLKKSAMMDEVYLFNNPFTFQSMEKHTAFCGMMRLGLHIPDTWLIPPKVAPANERFPTTAARYVKLFDLEKIADGMGYPLFLKPFDGGAWVGVNKVDDAATLHKAYDSSGERMMHLQKGILPYDVFCRALSIGPQTIILRYKPENPMHERYVVEHGFLDEKLGWEVETIGRLVNAFFKWEFNSCETIIKDGVVYPIDYANACPDVALTSLHYYFPWAMKALVRWAVFVAATGRRMAVDMDKRKYFTIGDDPALSYPEKLAAFRKMTDVYFEREAFEEFCAKHLAHFDEIALEYFKGPEFDDLLVASVGETFPAHEHEKFVAHFRGLIAHWIESQEKRAGAGTTPTPGGVSH